MAISLEMAINKVNTELNAKNQLLKEQEENELLTKFENSQRIRRKFKMNEFPFGFGGGRGYFDNSDTYVEDDYVEDDYVE